MEISKILGLILGLIMQKRIGKYKLIPVESINQEFRLKKTDEIKNYLIEEINQNALMSKKHKKV